MRCLRCGKEAAPNSAYCASCGKKASPNQKSPEKPERKDQDLYDEDGVLTFDPKKENYHEREDEDESNEKYFSERDRAYHRQMEEKRLKRVIMVDPKNPGKDIYVPDSLIASIIFTILCCQPLGLVAVYYAIQCNRYIAMGDKMNALHASKRARLWIIITIVVSIALMFLAGEIGKNKEKEAQPSPVQQETVAENQEAEAPETPETPAEPEEGTVMPEDEGIWTVDLDRAKKAAQEKGLKLMILFTGSDWCHWCKLLEGEIFSQEAFQKEAVDIVLPVKLDFPSKVKFPEAVRKKYEAEMKRYGIRGFPTVVLADPDGSAFAVCGYQQGGEQAYLEMLKALLADKKALEAKVAELKDGGADAARELFNVLEEYSAKFSHTPCVKEGLKKYYDICREKDPEISQTLEREEKIKERLAGIAEQHQIGEGYDPTKATKEIADQAAADYESLINEFSIEGEKKQEILQKAAIAYLIVRDEEKAEEYLDKAVEAAPDTDFAKMIQARKRAKEEEQENNNNQ
ncbi:CD225/dispanin family protein [bacterium]|nr:CD225/dispanin family protein [bacterium]